MMNGSMSEAHDGYATLDDVEPQTFARFSQWLYTGSYDSNSTKLGEVDTPTFRTREAMPVDDNVVDDPFGAWSQDTWTFSQKKRGGRGQQFYAADASKQQGLWASFSGGSSSEMPRKIPSAESATYIEYNNYYLTHAQLYCFSDKYDIVDLRQIAIDKLKQHLIDDVLLSSQRIAALVELIGFVSENTTSSGLENSDKLRDLVVQYTAITFEILFQNRDFQDILAANGDFSLEVMNRLLRRLD